MRPRSEDESAYGFDFGALPGWEATQQAPTHTRSRAPTQQVGRAGTPPPLSRSGSGRYLDVMGGPPSPLPHNRVDTVGISISSSSSPSGVSASPRERGVNVGLGATAAAAGPGGAGGLASSSVPNYANDTVQISTADLAGSGSGGIQRRAGRFWSLPPPPPATLRPMPHPIGEDEPPLAATPALAPAPVPAGALDYMTERGAAVAEELVQQRGREPPGEFCPLTHDSSGRG